MKQPFHSHAEGTFCDTEYTKCSQKKKYSTPKLIVHGTVQEITKTLDTGPSDGPTGTS